MVRKTTKIKETENKILSKSFIFSFLLAILFGVWAYYSLNIRQTKIEDARILAQLKIIILLPDDVMPTMAVVTDAEVLKAQQPIFFADVKNGDRLIIYPDLAIIYDYQANKIIKVGPVQNAQLQRN